jgi:hypothetical protein
MARIEEDVAAAALQAAVETLHRAFPRHSWTGIYFLRGDELVLGPFVGPPTEHVRIPRGRGLCGRAVREEKDLNVGDVASQPEYLACSADVRSELIVLVRDRGERSSDRSTSTPGSRAASHPSTRPACARWPTPWVPCSASSAAGRDGAHARRDRRPIRRSFSVRRSRFSSHSRRSAADRSW